MIPRLLISGAVLAVALGCVRYLVHRGTRGAHSSRLLGRVLNLAGRAPLSRYVTVAHARLYRATRGRALGRWFGNPVMVIETIGRRSGKRRATTITYLPHGQTWVIMPINGGSDRTPGWWLNLRAAGSGDVVVAGCRTPIRPRITQGQERDELWRAYVRQSPVMLEYARLTTRQVPVVVLEPAARIDVPTEWTL